MLTAALLTASLHGRLARPLSHVARPATGKKPGHPDNPPS